MSRLPALTALALALLVPAAVTRAADEPREVVRRYRAGHERLLAGRWSEAAAELREAVRLDPLFVPAHYALGQVCMALREYPDAVAAFVAARDAHEKVAAIRVTDIPGAERRRQEEVRTLREDIRLLRLAPDGVPGGVEAQVAALQARIQDLEREPLLPLGHAAVPPEFALALGSAYFRAGALADAEKAWRDAIRLRPRYGEAYQELAVLLVVSGRPGEARKAVEEAEKYGYPVSPAFRKAVEDRSRRP